MPLSFLIYSLYCQGFILAGAVTGCCLMRRNWQFRYKLLVILCCVTFAVELLALYFMMHGLKQSYIYNAWLPVETFTVTFVLLDRAVHAWARRVRSILLVIFPVGVVVSYILNPAFSVMNIYLTQAGLFTQLIASCVSLADILQDKDSLNRPLSARPGFWVAIGMLSSGSLFTIMVSIIQLLIKTKILWEFYMPFSYAANTCMYGGFIAAFITIKKQPHAPAADHVPALHSVPPGN
jgi:hypothetical protein